MAFDYSPLTELEAINVMLGVIGETPVNTINIGLVNVAIAYQTLYNESRQIQARGFNFNTDSKYPIYPSTAGKLILPPNTLKADITDDYAYRYDITIRGQTVYDKTNHTTVFTEMVTFDLVTFLDFTELPQAARDYITIRAARKFQRRILGSATIDQLTRDEEIEAKVLMENGDSDQADYNMIDSVDTAFILAR